ncbi:MAG: squalene/phytoene synthase family protein [Anaerolineae bacterium]|nr:squalene/phytoene synthase family protein [Anaerolineae bacterium]
MPENKMLDNRLIDSQHVAAGITRQASQQTYYTIKYLVDRKRTADAYRAYAYFRWVDDTLDQENAAYFNRLAFLERQKSLVDCSLWGVRPCAQTAEEQILVDLLRGEHDDNSGLLAYVRNMMAVMTFDTYRRGQFITQAELSEYERLLATAVTEAMHYFIGHNQYSPRNGTRYLAPMAAHITHMLRDTFEDIEAGYYNVPRELLAAHNISPSDVKHDAYRHWVKERVDLARHYFELGREYLLQVENGRCRLAGYAYIARFEGVLDTIEQDNYLLKPDYTGSKKLAAAAQTGWSTLSSLYQRQRHPRLVQSWRLNQS